MIQDLQQFVANQPGILQWAALALIAAIPFVEVYLGSAIGIVIGVPPLAAALAAMLGNAVAVLAIIFVADALRTRARRDRSSGLSPGQARVKKLFDRFGVPGVSLLLHPTQISAAGLIALGAPRTKVIIWQLTSIAVWGTAVVALASIGASVLA